MLDNLSVEFEEMDVEELQNEIGSGDGWTFTSPAIIGLKPFR